MERIARRIGILATVVCIAWGLTNFRASTFDNGWYRFAVLMSLTVGPTCFALLVRAECRARARARAKK
jgi:hypothetical protein